MPGAGGETGAFHLQAVVPLANWSASIRDPTVDVRRAAGHLHFKTGHRLESVAGSFVADQFCFANPASEVNATDSQYQ